MLRKISLYSTISIVDHNQSANKGWWFPAWYGPQKQIWRFFDLYERWEAIKLKHQIACWTLFSRRRCLETPNWWHSNSVFVFRQRWRPCKFFRNTKVWPTLIENLAGNYHWKAVWKRNPTLWNWVGRRTPFASSRIKDCPRGVLPWTHPEQISHLSSEIWWLVFLLFGTQLSILHAGSHW